MIPLIGIPGRRRKGADFTTGLDIYADADFDVYFADYARAIVEAGGIPVHLTVEVDPALVVARLDGLVLPGGPDVHPRFYDDAASEATDVRFVDERRDAFELGLVAAAVDRGIPILGICRGLQVVNVHFGGTLVPHVGSHGVFDRPADHEAHGVRLDPDSTLGRLLGERLPVNSLHHQAAASVGDGLRAVGWADDGLVEAIESTETSGHRILGVQWHAEKLATRSIDPLFRWIVAEAAGDATLAT